MKRIAIALAAMALIAAASPAEETRHTVKDGETLNGIANRAGVSAGAIARANKLSEPYAVRSGQVLIIPRDKAKAPQADPARPKAAAKASASGNAGTYVVKDGETLNGVANRAGVSATALAQANKLTPPYALRSGQKLALPHGTKNADSGKPASAGSPASHAPRMGETYTVQPGETFNGIATRAGIPRSVLAQANGLTEPYVVKTGQTLHIPRQKTHIVAAGETARGIANKYGVPYDAILTANGLAKDAPIKTGRKLVIPAIIGGSAPASAAVAPAAPKADSGFRWPLKGKILTRFDPQASGTPHRGIDIEAAVGQPVVAAKAGKVIYADEEPVRYGKTVVLEHEGQWYSAYAHLSSISVAKGDPVKAGDVVGYAGSTGDAKQPQLHFELRQANQPIDPLTKLP